jgi:predicted aldo/keto reductase-like oxidoreductase
MKRVRLGRTGLEVVRMGLGGIPIQRVDEETAIATVMHAVEKGVDFIDTARAYTTSEVRIGKALKRINRPVVLASKSPARSAEGIYADIQKSLADLQQPYIDLYQCHFVKDGEDYESIIASGGALKGLERARQEGLIGHIGITSHSLDLFDRILDDDLFEAIMVCFSFLEPAAADTIIPKALARDVGVVAMKSFSGGAIEEPALALSYVLQQPQVVIIPGVETPALFDVNWRIFQSAPSLSEGDRAAIENVREIQDKRFCRRCDYCQPCTEEIPIQTLLGLPMALKRFGPAFLDKDWVRNAIEKARNCSRCEECLPRCPYSLPIPDLIEENLTWLDKQLSESGH